MRKPPTSQWLNTKVYFLLMLHVQHGEVGGFVYLGHSWAWADRFYCSDAATATLAGKREHNKSGPDALKAPMCTSVLLTFLRSKYVTWSHNFKNVGRCILNISGERPGNIWWPAPRHTAPIADVLLFWLSALNNGSLPLSWKPALVVTKPHLYIQRQPIFGLLLEGVSTQRGEQGKMKTWKKITQIIEIQNLYQLFLKRSKMRLYS